MEEDILNYSPTVMFRGTPSRFYTFKGLYIYKYTFPIHSDSLYLIIIAKDIIVFEKFMLKL